MFVLVFRFSMSACASDRVPYFPYIHLSWLLSFSVLLFFILRGFVTKFKGLVDFSASGDRLSFGVLSSFWGDGSTCQKLGFSFALSLSSRVWSGNSFEFYLWALYEICLRSFSGCHRWIWAVKLCPGVGVFGIPFRLSFLISALYVNTQHDFVNYPWGVTTGLKG